MRRVDTRKACANCRQRHLKCDREQPSCRRCKLSNLTCSRHIVRAFRNVRFDERHNPTEHREEVSSPVLSGHGPWSRDVFIDETDSVIETHKNTAMRPASPRLMNQSRRRASETSSQPSNLSPSATYFFNNPPSIIGLPLATGVHHVGSISHGLEAVTSTSSGQNQSPPGSFPSPSSAVIFGHDLAMDVDVRRTSLASISSQLPPLQTSASITHPREAYLLKFFTQTWGPIFDCLDADLTFTKSVLHIALTSFAPLFWAILATSALQLSRVSDYPFSAAKYYRSQCSKSIMPILLRSAQPGANEETLFATYVMLRNYEHLTENLMEKNTETLFTAALAISANPSETLSDKMDLGRGAFWVHLRQDIHVALLLQVPINIDYPPCLQREKMLEDLDLITSQKATVRQEAYDCAWANRVAVLLFDIINYCFQNGPRELETWIAFRSRLDHWRIAKPRRFQPYYERAPDPSESRVFPDIWISSDCQVLAWLYYHTATVLLKTYPPSSEDTSFSGQVSKAPTLSCLESREEVLIHARAICGIGITNPNAQALIVVCHMVTISAIFFTNEAEQKETINLIRMAHSVTGHPVYDVEQKLVKYWGCPSDQ